MWRSKYDMPPDDFAKELDRLWEQVRPLYLSLHAYVRNRLREKYGDAVPATGADPRRPAGQHVGAGLGQYLSAGRPRQCRPRIRPHRPAQEAQHRLEADGQVRRELLHVARDSRRCPRRSGSARSSSSRETARWCATPAPGTSIRWTTAPQDVHPDHRRGFPHDPPRTGAQFLPARLLQAAAVLPRQRQRRLPRSGRRHHRALDHARIPGQDRPARPGAGHLQGHRPAAAPGAGEDRVPAIRAGDRPVALEGIFGRDSAGEV